MSRWAGLGWRAGCRDVRPTAQSPFCVTPKVAALLLCEALWLALLATVLGVLAGQGLTALIGWTLQLEKSLLISAWSWPVELLSVPLLALFVALFSALLPAWDAYRVSAFELLQSR